MKKQMNIRVTKHAKKRPTWSVQISTPDELGLVLSVLLPGEFQRYKDARAVANVLATMYRANGYMVALDTKSCNKRPLPATAAYGVA